MTRITTRVALIASFAIVATTAHADDRATSRATDTPAGLLCVFPQAKPLEECFKGSSLGEEFVAECTERNKRRKKVPPRVRIDKGAWVEFSPTKWRCLRVPTGKPFTYQIENYGKVRFSDQMTIPSTPCASGRFDLIRPWFYESVWAKCSKRKSTTRDEVMP